ARGPLEHIEQRRLASLRLLGIDREEVVREEARQLARGACFRLGTVAFRLEGPSGRALLQCEPERTADHDEGAERDRRGRGRPTPYPAASSTPRPGLAREDRPAVEKALKVLRERARAGVALGGMD